MYEILDKYQRGNQIVIPAQRNSIGGFWQCVSPDECLAIFKLHLAGTVGFEKIDADGAVYTITQAHTVINGRTAYCITIIDAADGRTHSGISFHVDFASAYDYANRVILRDYAPQSMISSITLTTL